MMFEVLKLTLIPVGFATVAVAWVHGSRQSAVPRDTKHSVTIVLKALALIGLLTYLAHAGLHLSANAMLGIAPFALLLAFAANVERVGGGSPESMAIAMALLLPIYLAKQFVLGFPDRKEFILEPDPYNSRDDACESFQGKTGVVSTSLRPMGSVIIDGIDFPAKTDDGDFIPAKTPIIVLRGNSRLLVVARSNTSPSIP